MIRDVVTIMWKERRERAGSQRRLGSRVVGLLFPVFTLLLMAVVPPLAVGPGWTESPFALLASVFVPFMAAMSTVSDAFAGERERKTLETLLASRLPDRAILFGKIAVPLTNGLGATVLAHVLSLLVLNIVYRGGGLLIYSARWTLLILSLAFLAGLLVTCLGVLMSLKAVTVQQATLNFIVAIMAPPVAALGVGYFMAAVFPESWDLFVSRLLADGVPLANFWTMLTVMFGVLIVLDLGLLLLSMHQFQRSRLRLD